MRPPPSIIWLEASARIARQKAFTTFTDIQAEVLNYLWEHYPDLYMGAPDQVYTKESILELSRHLSQKVSTIKKRGRFDFLARGFEQGNLTLPGWDVPLGPVYIKINREENFSRQELFRPHNNAESFLTEFARDIEAPPPKDNQALIGQILVSAILFGGLLNRKWLKPFQDCILDKRIFQEGSLVWVDMEDHPSTLGRSKQHSMESAKAASHRLPLDHLTRLLVYRYLRLSEKNPPKSLEDPWKDIVAYFKGASYRQNTIPHSLNEIFIWAFARYLTLLPPSLVAYASGKLPATSLPTGPWLRTISEMAVPIKKSAPLDTSESPGSRPKITVNRDTKKSEQQKLLSNLLKSLRHNKKSSKKTSHKITRKKISPRKARSIISVFMNENKSHLSATFQLILHWSLRLLKEKVSHLERRKKQQVRTTSVDRYLLSFGYALLRSAGDLPLHTLDPQDLETVYEQTAIRLGKNRFALQRLRQFHGFLQTFYNVPAMDWIELMETDGKTIANVNANLITSQTYLLVLKSLGWGKDKLTRWQTLHVIALILLYRCGLRPSEVQALRLIDIQGVKTYEILIRNSLLNDIKTNNGIRRISTSKMIPKDELDFLLAFYKKRIEENATLKGGLFLSHPVQLERMLFDDQLFTPIRKALRAVTKDESLLLYHLRHSFLTWTNFILQADKAHSSWCHQLNYLPQEDIERTKGLYRSLARNEPWGRKDQYLLAMLAGHSSPEITHRHYSHLLDLALHLHLVDPTASIPINYRSVMALTGHHRSMAFDLPKVPEGSHCLHRVVKNEASKFKNELRHPLMAQMKPMKLAISQTPPTAIPPWEEAIEAIYTDSRLKSLRRANNEWELAAALYEAVRAMDGRRIKTARKAITYAHNHFNDRWGGITFSIVLEAKRFMSFLENCGLAKSQVVVVYHPSKNQDKNTAGQEIRYWAENLKISTSQIFIGEQAPVKAKAKRQITIKIVAQTQVKKIRRIPKMSYGFRVAIELLVTAQRHD